MSLALTGVDAGEQGRALGGIGEARVTDGDCAGCVVRAARKLPKQQAEPKAGGAAQVKLSEPKGGAAKPVGSCSSGC